ncbi:MAG: FecR domain-containing protein [Pseudomonadota bacterium]
MTTSEDPMDERVPLQREAWKWVLRLTSGDATTADLAALARWRALSPGHDAAFADASRRWHAFGPALARLAQRPGEALARPQRGQIAIGRRAMLGGALAASVATAGVLVARPPLGLWPSFDALAADYRTGPGERQRIALAASASVDLNTRTSLNLHKASLDAPVDRVELIDGEAAVTTSVHRVEVVAANGRVWAEDAAFNVRFDGAEVCVTCLSGRVNVEQRQAVATITPGQQASYGARGLAQTMSVDATAVAGWLGGDLFFRDQPLTRVIDEVNRYRPGRIVLMNAVLGQRRVTARFKLDRLDVVITQLHETFGARVTALPGGLVLVG